MSSRDLSQFRNFHEYLDRRAEEMNNASCLTFGEKEGLRFSYAQLNEKVNQAAGFLKKIGIGKGDKFATLMMNCTEFFFLYLASMKMGSLIMPLVADLPLGEIVAMIREFDVKLLFVDEERIGAGLEAKKRAKEFLIEVFVVNPSSKSAVPDFSSALSNASGDISFDNVRMEDPGSLYFSSGSSGKPKGIPQSPKNLLVAAYALADAYGFHQEDSQMGVLPVYHTALATYGFWPGLCAGSNFVIFSKFSKNNFWQNLAKYKIAFVEVVPTILSMLLNPSEDISDYDLSNLKFIGCGSAPLPVGLHQRFEDVFGIPVANQYGLSETEPTHFNPPQRHLRKEGAIGKVLPMCEAKIFDDNDRELLSREVGEIVIKGENVITGYYKNPQADIEAFSNGWFHTGDLGYVDEDGFFFLVDRKKDIIVRGGAKIYPNEVDNVLFSHPSVMEAVAFGVPDEIYGEEVMACVVLKEDCRPQEEDVMAYCAKHLPSYKCPKKIYLVASIPKTASGKLLRREIARMYKGKSG